MTTTNDAEPETLPPALLACAEQAVAALEALRRQAAVESGDPTGTPAADDLVLTWRAGGSAETLAAQVYRAALRSAADREPLQTGRVYCYHCANAICDHSQPDAPGHVFAGYANTGSPIWRELSSFLNEMGDDRVDRLFGGSRAIVARVISRKTLIQEQFSAYGRDSLTYRIVGQVVGGHWELDGSRHALTVQIVETADHALGLQTLASPALLAAIYSGGDSESGRFYQLHGHRRQLARRVQTLSTAWQGCLDRKQRAELRGQIFTALRQFAAGIERQGRQGRRRTQHAQERAQQDRPVAKAVEDVAAAGPGDFYRDRKTQSVVVIGKRGRSHVFSGDGRHITSLALPGDLLERRKARRRYVPLDPDERDTFRLALQPPG